MNFNQFVWRNTYRNKHLYLAYFLSTLFAVTVFFTFSVFAFNPSLHEGLANFNTVVTTSMFVANGIIYAFAFFFVLYSVDIFLQSRKREFGTFMMQGMSANQLKKMVFQENLVIGVLATICGILVGLFFSQGILLISDRLLGIELEPYFPIQAIIVTFVCFLVLFFFISVFIRGRLPKFTLQELLKSDKFGKGELILSPKKAILGVILIAIGYAIAMVVEGLQVAIAMVPVVVLVIVGTRLLFNQFTIFFVQKMKNRKKLFWNKTNLLVLSDLAFRMKDNARAFFLVAIISTVGFSAIGSLMNFRQSITFVAEAIPYEFSYHGEDIPDFSTKFEEALAEKNVQVTSATFDSLLANDFVIVSQSGYNTLAQMLQEEKVQVADGQVLIALSDNPTLNQDFSNEVTIGDNTLAVANKFSSDTVEALRPTMIVTDSMFEQLKGDFTLRTTRVWEPTVSNEEAIINLGNLFMENTDFYGRTATIEGILAFYTPILFVGVFIGIVFFAAAGSFLYFRLFSDMQVDETKFRMIRKIGLTKKELKKIVSQQVGILFFTPIVVALVHGGVALNAMNRMFHEGLQLIDVKVLGVFLLIQVVYYVICRHFYYRHLTNKLGV